MSIKLMSAAWDLDIPATEKMVLLCLCDYANAEGTCWPGAEGIGKRCSLTERTVRKAIKWLMDEGLLGAQIRPGKTAVYKIDPGSKFTPEANSPRNMTAQPRKEIPDTPEAASDEPSRTIKEPSKETLRSCASADARDLVNDWNGMAADLDLPKVAKLTEQRKRAIRSRLKQNTMDEWKEAFRAIRRSRFCQGENDRGWKADFDFLLQPKSFTRLIEGFYDGKV